MIGSGFLHPESIVGHCCGCGQFPLALFLVPHKEYRYRCADCFQHETGNRHAQSPPVSNPPTLLELATSARAIIGRATRDGLTIDDGNVIDLLADNLTHTPLETLRVALVVAGLADQYPRASVTVL